MSTEATTGRPAHANDTTFDSLADLFLGDDPHREPTHRAIETRGLIVGHLPVLASAWVAQHARDLAAERNAPIAVVSRAGGRVTIDLHGQHDRLTPANTLDDAIEQAMHAGVCAWLLRVDAVTELALGDSPQITSLSILTGHDEAALVAAYRALKGLTGTDHDPGFDDAPQIHLAIMGATDAQGRPAAEKLRRATESFLQTGLASVSITEKIAAGSAARLYDGDSNIDIDQLLDSLPAEHEPPAATAPLRLSHGDHASRIGPVDTHPDSADPATIAAVRPLNEPTSDRLPSPPRAETLAPLLGLASLQPRCPYADEVELAADAEGRAHLIIHAEGATHTLAGALESLEIARTWLTAHVTLLAAATNNAVRSGPPLDPACHLVVDHAAGARRLLDSPTRVYALAQGRSEQLCIPLN
ncbi:MAG: hypothetical protein AAFR76_11635 [Planctomycetota bacterium]